MKNEEKHIKYLTDIGFRACTNEEKRKITEENYLDIPLERYFCHIYEGDLTIDTLELDTIPLIITGNLTVKQDLLCTWSYNGLIVFGETKAKSLFLEGETFFFGGVTFENVLMASGHAEKIINTPKGKVLSLDGDGTTLQNLEPENIAVFMDEMGGWDDKSYGDVRDYISEEFLDFKDEFFMTYEEWLDGYSEDEGTEKEFEVFRARNIILDSWGLRHAILDGKKVFLD